MALTKVTGSVIKDSVSLSGNVSVGGTLTYQDVTNVDALGVGTFRSGINVSGGQLDVGSNIKIGSAGMITASNFKTGVANLHSTGLTLTGGQLDVGSNIKVGTAGVITATTFSGSGANLTNLNASNIASGTVPTARLGSGTANSSTFLRGDSTFQTVNTDLVSDTSPQLGGDLQSNGNNIDFAEIDKLRFGTDQDLRIWHQTNSNILGSSGVMYLHNTGASATDLDIRAQNDILLRPQNGEQGIKIIGDGAVELYHDGTKKIETTNTGAIVTGILTATAFKGDMVPATYHGGRRNMFINGDFIVSQRGDRDPHANRDNGANNLGYGGPDHVQVVSNLGAYYARQKNSASAPRAEAGATCSYELDVTTANASPGSNAYTFLNVMWNGNEAGRLLYGTSSARPVTISFWCYSNKTGNFVINMRNYSTDRQINQVVSISSSNTWEYKTVTFVGDTASAISATLDARWAIEFWLDAGTDYTSGSNQSVWGTRVDNRRASGCTLAIASSTSNYFRMALLQVEMGPYATPFEFRTYSEYLHDCEYYFQKPFSSRGSNQAFAIHIWGHKIADTYALRVQSMMRPTEMRINPTDYFHDNNPSGLTAQRFQTQGSDYEYTYNIGMSIGSNKKEFAGGTKYPYGVNGISSAESGILFAFDFESYAEL